MSFALAVLGSWLLAAAPPPALEPATQDYAQGRFVDSLRRAEAVAKAQGTSDEVAAQAQLLRARCFDALRDVGRADEALRAALARDPSVALDLDADPPALVQRLESLRRKLRGHLRVTVDPEGAQVSLDGYDEGAHGFDGDVTIGTHTLHAAGAEGTSVDRTVVVRPFAASEVSIVLPRAAPSTPPPRGGVPAAPAVRAREAGATSDGVLHSFFIDARAQSDLSGGFSPGFGLGFGRWHFLANANVILGAVPAAELQLGAEWRRALGPVGGYLALEGTMFFASGGALLGYGATAGVTVEATRFLEPFAAFTFSEVDATPRYRPTYALVSLGVRLRIP